MPGPKVSVIIPAYNRAVLLSRAIESVLIQKGPQWELIVVDDGSTDGTASTANRYSSHPNVCVYQRRHGGVSAARNFGVRQSNAPVIAFLDSDDEWLKGKLEAQLPLIERDGYDIVQTREIWIRNGRRVNPPNHLVKLAGDIFKPSLERCMITPSSVMMTKALFNRYGGFDEEMTVCEDYDLWLRITAKHPIGLIDGDYLIRYGGHADQLSASQPGLDAFRIRALVKLLEGDWLETRQVDSAKKVLSKKLEVYRQGCVKRGKKAEIKWCEDIALRYLP